MANLAYLIFCKLHSIENRYLPQLIAYVKIISLLMKIL